MADDENDGASEVNDERLNDNMVVAENVSIGVHAGGPLPLLQLAVSSIDAEEPANEADPEAAILASPGANMEIETREPWPPLEPDVLSDGEESSNEAGAAIVASPATNMQFETGESRGWSPVELRFDEEESSSEADPEAASLGSPATNMEIETREPRGWPPLEPEVSSTDGEESSNEADPEAAIVASPREPRGWSPVVLSFDEEESSNEADPGAAILRSPPVDRAQILARIEANSIFPSVVLLDRIENSALYSALESTEDESPGEIMTVDLSDSPPNRTSPLTTPRRKKRKRTVTPKQTVPSPGAKGLPEDDDGGLQCSICLDDWTISGEHRVVSLKCGHLFGQSCITRWLQSNMGPQRCCATCKARASLRDLRPIYAKAVRAVDTTREVELTEELKIEREKVTELRIKLGWTNMELANQRQLAAQYKVKLDSMSAKDDSAGGVPTGRPTMYMLHMDKNIEISHEPGCRVMAYAAGPQILLVSLKSTQVLFPGYAVRMLRGPEFTAIGTVLVSSQSIRDIAVDAADALFACATMEKTVKVFSIEQRSIKLTITPDPEAAVWSCAFDKERPTCLYLGTLRGSVYVYDIRQPEQCLKEFQVGHAQNDFTAVIRICPVEPTPTIPFGGFLVCKLKSLWFFEYTDSEQVTENRLNVGGPFWSMSYNAVSRLVLVTQRVTRTGQRTTHVLGMLEKWDDVFSFDVHHVFEGSQVQTTMLRNAQLLMPNGKDTLVAAFLDDDRKLATWSTNSGPRPIQKLPMGDTILDICPVKLTPHQTHVATLCSRRCRIYHLESAK